MGPPARDSARHREEQRSQHGSSCQGQCEATRSAAEPGLHTVEAALEAARQESSQKLLTKLAAEGREASSACEVPAGRLRLRLTPVGSVGSLGSLRCAAPGARRFRLCRALCHEPATRRRIGSSSFVAVTILVLGLG